MEDTSLTVNSPSRCVSWNPLNQKLLATGLFNGNIVVFDMATAEVKHILRACSAEEEFRVMHIQWHPFFDNMLAAAGSDNDVHIFDLKKLEGRRLSFHKNRVRSIHWNSEIPWMLVSGGDDSYQVIWDVR